LIYDGLLTLNLGGENKRGKNIELHVLLLEECIMFLQKMDEKFLLKFHTGSSELKHQQLLCSVADLAELFELYF
jgi:hypothetical protein